MSLTLLEAPAVEPIAREEAKLFLRIDGSTEDTLIDSLITTSRMHIEAALGLALIRQRWQVALDCWPVNGTLEVPLAPLESIDEVRVLVNGGPPETIALDRFVLDGRGRVPRVAVRYAGPPLAFEPIVGLELDLTAGYGAAAADVPAPIRHAALLLVAHWYDVREPALVGSEVTRVPHTVSDLLMPYRRVQL